MSNAPQKPQAFSHMLWFFIIPCVGFLLWAGYQWVGALTSGPAPSVGIEKQIDKIKTARTPGDRWQAAYGLSQDLQKMRRTNDWESLDSTRKEKINSDLSDLLKKFSSDSRLTKYLLLTLGQLKDSASLAAISQFLKSKDSDQKFFSAWAFLEILQNRPEAITEEHLATVIGWLRDEDPGFRKIAASFLAQRRDPKISNQILPLLEDPNVEVRWNAAVALTTVGDSRGHKVLGEVFSLENLRSLNFRSSKDLTQLVAAAWGAAIISGNAELVSLGRKLKTTVSPSTPEGRAIHSAIVEPQA